MIRLFSSSCADRVTPRRVPFSFETTMTRSTFLPTMLAVWLTVFIFGTTSASAQQLIFWIGGDSGNFNNASNWDGQVPGSSGLAIFTIAFANSDDVTVNFTGNVTNQGLAVGNLALTLNLAGFTYTLSDAVTMTEAELLITGGTLSANTAAIDLGSVLTVADDATFLTDSAILGGTAGSFGQVDIAGGIFDVSAALILGNVGTGVLNIGHDGMDSTGDGGDVTATSVILGAGSGGQGTINMGAGATFETETATIGAGNNSSGTVNVGDDATWTNSGAITVGALGSTGGSGEINVQDGGLLHTQSVTVGNNGAVGSTGAGAIVITDTMINLNSLSQSLQNQINAGGLFVAGSGLTIINGGLVESTRAFIDGFAANQFGSALVSGQGSLLDLDGGNLIVGRNHNGTLNIAAGGQVNSGNTTIGNAASATGVVNVSGQDGSNNFSQLNVDGSLTVGNQGSGELFILDGAQVNVTGDGGLGITNTGSGRIVITGASGNNASILDIGGDMTIGYVPAGGGAVSLGNSNATMLVASGGVVSLNGGAGTLFINGSGQLSGNGLIDGHVQLSGRLAPSVTNQPLTITGDLETFAGSIIQVQYSSQELDLAAVFPNLDPTLVDDLRASGYVAVEGQATLADGTIFNIIKLGGGAVPGDTIIVLHAEMGGLDPNAPPDLDIQSSFLVNWTPEVLESNGESFLKLTAVLDEPGLGDFLTGLTGNLKNVGNALAEGELFELLTLLDPNDPESGLRTLLPLQHGAAAIQNIRTSQYFNTAFFQEMAGLRMGMRDRNIVDRDVPRMFGASSIDTAAIARASTSLDHAAAPIALGAFEELAGTWGGYVSGMGSWDRVDSGDDRIGHRARVAGVQGGVHKHLSRDLLLGVSAAYLSTSMDFRNDFGDGSIDTFRGGPYASWTPGGGALFVDAAATYGYHRNEMDRNTLVGTARSRYDAYDISVSGQAGYEFTVGDNLFITPLLGAEYTHLRTDSFRESGAGAANLAVSSMTTDSMRVRLGGRVAHIFEFDETILVPELYAGWAYEMLDTDVDLQSRFIAGGPSFATRAAGVNRNALQVSGGFTAMAGTYMTLFIRYEGEFQSDRTNHGIVGGVDIRF